MRSSWLQLTIDGGCPTQPARSWCSVYWSMNWAFCLVTQVLVGMTSLVSSSSGWVGGRQAIGSPWKHGGFYLFGSWSIIGVSVIKSWVRDLPNWWEDLVFWLGLTDSSGAFPWRSFISMYPVGWRTCITYLSTVLEGEGYLSLPPNWKNSKPGFAGDVYSIRWSPKIQLPICPLQLWTKTSYYIYKKVISQAHQIVLCTAGGCSWSCIT